MKKVKILFAVAALTLAIGTSAFVKSAKFVSYFSSSVTNPSAPAQFDSQTAIDQTVIKASFCPGADVQTCRYEWLPSHVTLNGSGQPTGIAINPGTGLPYPPDAIVKKP